MNKLVIAIAVLVVYMACFLFLRGRHARRIQEQTRLLNQARQAEIQLLLDELGTKLRSERTTLAQGEAAALLTLSELDRLNIDGVLDPLIADTQEFFNGWRAAKSV